MVNNGEYKKVTIEEAEQGNMEVYEPFGPDPVPFGLDLILCLLALNMKTGKNCYQKCKKEMNYGNITLQQKHI